MKAAKPTIEIYATPDDVYRAAAKKFTRIAHDAITQHGQFTVALSGGSTPQALYALLADTPYCKQIDWRKVHFFWGDERAVAADHPDSNYRMADETLLKKLDVPQNHIHRMPADEDDLNQAAWNYQHEIAEVFNISSNDAPPHFDLILLGMGDDGHTASLFPHTEALHENVRWVVANYIPKLDNWRMTFTSNLISQAAHIIFIVTGKNKAAIFENVLHGIYQPDQLPSQLARKACGKTFWLIDNNAAGALHSNQ